MNSEAKVCPVCGSTEVTVYESIPQYDNPIIRDGVVINKIPSSYYHKCSCAECGATFGITEEMKKKSQIKEQDAPPTVPETQEKQEDEENAEKTAEPKTEEEKTVKPKKSGSSKKNVKQE